MENINEKLDLLHNCLAINSIPKELPKELSKYEAQFTQFKDVVKDCQSSTEEIYLAALRVLRDQLLH